MTRMSKKGKRRNVCPKKRTYVSPALKTGSKKDNLPKGFKEHVNTFESEQVVFIPKVK